MSVGGTKVPCAADAGKRQLLDRVAGLAHGLDVRVDVLLRLLRVMTGPDVGGEPVGIADAQFAAAPP